uniref:NADH dehydrogenase [ubiquinone] 1 beta subcomplex subunit 4 n=1 Tax=Myxine glutinosa TaxID=7769 RepID=UPI00358F4E22
MASPKWYDKYTNVPEPFRPPLTDKDRVAAVDRALIRARLKRLFLFQHNDPARTGLIADPAINRWARAHTYDHGTLTFRASPRTAVLGLLTGLFPIVAFAVAMHMERVHRTAEAVSLARLLSVTT